MDDPISFGKWVKLRRKTLGLTQKELARQVGYSISALRKIESDERRPSRQTAEVFANELNIQERDRQIFIQVARGLRAVEQLPPAISPSLENRPVRKIPREHPSNLPLPLADLVGREAELAILHRRFHDPHCRLINLVGPGGIGKTRLALEAAILHQEEYSDGAYFITLSSSSSPLTTYIAIADGLNLAPSDGIPLKVGLLDHLIQREILLVLDNLEQLTDGIDPVVKILQRAPHVKILATSLERLNLEGEWVVEVHGLPYPLDDQIEGQESFGSVALFLECAWRERADFSPGAEDRVWINRICRMVEGIPLGIELAAAWVKLLTCEEIGKEIACDLNFLSGSLREVPERHHSMRAVFDYTWRRLNPEERRGLCQLAAFEGCFSLQDASREARVNLQLLSALVDKSLLQNPEKDRYELHELLRRYARSKWDESG
jgi:predicted ATPase/DNA-binding XRE family transcriptional regulator